MNVWEMVKQYQADETPVCVFLTSGVQLRGVITFMDGDGINLTRGNETCPVMRGAVATVTVQGVTATVIPVSA